MDWQTLFYTTGGTVSRAWFLAAILVYSYLAFLVWFSAEFLLTSDTTFAPFLSYVGFKLVYGLMFFSLIAISIKRLRDRDKTGW
jgi:uncharacterized membrane protein YhaH (DUF805 family)